MTESRIQEVVRRLRHLMPNLENDGHLNFVRLTKELCEATEQPIPMVLHCPRCGTQHIDEPSPGWDNPVHTSHKCQKPGCGTIWRPADMPTIGVLHIQTCGKTDNWMPAYVVVRHPDDIEQWNIIGPDGKYLFRRGRDFASCEQMAGVCNREDEQGSNFTAFCIRDNEGRK